MRPTIWSKNNFQIRLREEQIVSDINSLSS
uniref:Uncharacterized protein n=1 Tax=Rhizophora mucronata TaxID=61149 RepID=A0A2P2J862_RHIMU